MIETFTIQIISFEIVTEQKFIKVFNTVLAPLWQYRLWSFQTRGTKLERFLPKN